VIDGIDGCTSVDEDRDKLNKLLDWWTEASYDYYVAWLTETVDSMKQAGMIKDKLKVAGQEVDAIFFHLPTEPHGFLSNWYPSPFDLDSVHFTSAEQYIMHGLRRYSFRSKGSRHGRHEGKERIEYRLRFVLLFRSEALDGF
jgi:hypothetical protein